MLAQVARAAAWAATSQIDSSVEHFCRGIGKTLPYGKSRQVL
jgi:hypothetical protein